MKKPNKKIKVSWRCRLFGHNFWLPVAGDARNGTDYVASDTCRKCGLTKKDI